MGKLFIVGTPIGNLEDITLRAIRTLKESDIILCEDTRVTKRLLEHYDIVGKQLLTYNEKPSGLNPERVAEMIGLGKTVALVTDAGTPGISDPGSFLVSKVREAMPEIKIESIPGASALTAALSIAGITGSEFVFLGFLPHKKGRETLFKEIAASKRPAIFYESPHRILKTLQSLGKIDSAIKVTLCRELTKIYEEVVSGNPGYLEKYFADNPEKLRGEFVVIASSAKK